VHGSHVWVAGSPGTRVFHSADLGRSWRSFATGQMLPLRALTFVDDKQGWAVGELGTILATDDGGYSWHVQRPAKYPAGRRAALLAVFARAQDVPLEAIAEIGVAEGYLATISLLHKPSADGLSTTTQETSACWYDAMLSAGAASTDIRLGFSTTPCRFGALAGRAAGVPPSGQRRSRPRTARTSPCAHAANVATGCTCDP